jgi:hypothetical protein
MPVDYEQDWAGRLQSRLFAQFATKPKIKAWAAMLARQATDLEDAAQAILTITNIDGSIGAQLDVLGRFINQPRVGLDDVTYRQYLRARILANKSVGTPEALYRVFLALFPGAALRITTSAIGVKAFKLSVGAVAMTVAQIAAAISFLRDSKEAGARAILEYQQVPDSQLLRWNAQPGFERALVITTLDGPSLAGATTLPVLNTNSFVIAGESSTTLQIGDGATQEQVQFTIDDTATFDISPLAFNHSGGERVQYVLSQTGGIFGGAQQAGAN